MINQPTASKEDLLMMYSTEELVNALIHREGVEAQWVKPYQNKSIKVNGPAYLITVID